MQYRYFGARIFAIACVIAAISGGCASVQPPTATITNVAAGDVSGDGFAVNLAVQLQNPNAVSLPLSSAQYTLKLGGVQVVNDATKTGGEIPAHGSTAITIPIRLKFEDLLAAEQAIVTGRGSVPYDAGAVLHFNPANGVSSAMSINNDVQVPVHSAGNLSLENILNSGVLSGNPTIQRLALKVFGFPGRLPINP